jgi:hypothetical protein
MAGRSVNDALAPEVILREVTRIQLPGTTLSDLFGWGMSARDPATQTGNMIDYDLREGSYDTFNRTQDIASGRVPGTANFNLPPQKVGRVRFAIPRAAERIPLSDEELVNRRQIGQAVTVIDSMGENYLMRQKRFLAERIANMIEFQTAAMLRGSYTYDQQGDELRQGFSGGSETIDFQIPSGNKNQLDMLGNGAIISAGWNIPSTDIPAQLLAMNDQMNALCGMGIEHGVCNSATFQYLINNDKIKGQAGTSNTPYESYVRRGPGEYAIVLKAIPWLQWHIIDYRLNLWNGTTTSRVNLVGTDQVNLFPTPSPAWVQYCNGGEVVTEGPNGVRAFRHGAYFYGYAGWDPSGWNLCSVHNGFPMLYNPNAIINADVTP